MNMSKSFENTTLIEDEIQFLQYSTKQNNIKDATYIMLHDA